MVIFDIHAFFVGSGGSGSSGPRPQKFSIFLLSPIPPIRGVLIGVFAYADSESELGFASSLTVGPQY